MSNSESFTGGSGDLNPQYFNIKNFVQTGTDATTSITYSLAIDRLRGRGEFIGVLEIFRVYWYPTTVGVNITWNRTYILSTKNNGTVQAGAGDGTVIAEYTEGYQSATAVGIYPQVHPFVMDLTDGAGHGLLVATDSISLQCASTATNQTNGCDVKILYRYKNVPIQEYVGIVQSQT